MKTQLFASLFDSLSIIAVGIFLLFAVKRGKIKISDPAKKTTTERIAKYAGIMAIFGGLISGIANFPKIISPGDIAVEFAHKLNESSPKQLDSVTRFNKATAGPGPLVVVDETIMLKASDITDDAWQKFLPQLRQNIMNSQMGVLPSEGITLIIRYSDEDGAKFHDVVFSPSQPTK